jgi:hypothetical protein
MAQLQTRSGSVSVAELVHEGLMEGLEAWDHHVDLVLAGEDRAPDVPCPGGPLMSRDLVASRAFASGDQCQSQASTDLLSSEENDCMQVLDGPATVEDFLPD